MYLKRTSIVLLYLWLTGCESRFGRNEIVPLYSDSNGSPYLSKGLVLSDLYTLEEFIRYLSYYEKVNWENVASDLDKYLNNELRGHKLVNELMAKYHVSRGNIDEALVCNIRAENLGVESINIYLNRSGIYMLKEEYSLALDYINKAVLMNENDPDVYLLKGYIYLGLGDSVAALTYKRKGFSYDSSRLDVAYDLAFLYAQNKNFDAAHELIYYMESHDFREVEIMGLYARLLRHEQNDLEANKVFSFLLDEGQPDAGVALLKYFKATQDYDSLIYYGNQVLAIDSTNIEALSAKAIAFENKGYYSSALIYFNRMLATDSLHEEGLNGVIKVNRKIAYLQRLREAKGNDYE